MLGIQVNVSAETPGKYLKIVDVVVVEGSTAYIACDTKGKDVQVVTPGEILKFRKGDVKSIGASDDDEDEE